MTITQSRLKSGTLTIDAVDFAGQASNVRLTPSVTEEGDRLEVLSGDVLEPEELTEWALEFTGVQDFDDEDGWVEFCRASAGDVVAFTWEPNSVAAPSYAGTCKVRAVVIGGDVAARLTSDASFPVVTGPTPTYPA